MNCSPNRTGVLVEVHLKITTVGVHEQPAVGVRGGDVFAKTNDKALPDSVACRRGFIAGIDALAEGRAGDIPGPAGGSVLEVDVGAGGVEAHGKIGLRTDKLAVGGAAGDNRGIIALEGLVPPEVRPMILALLIVPLALTEPKKKTGGSGSLVL